MSDGAITQIQMATAGIRKPNRPSVALTRMTAAMMSHHWAYQGVGGAWCWWTAFSGIAEP